MAAALYLGLSSLLDLVFGSSLCSYQDEISLIKDPERNPYPKKWLFRQYGHIESEPRTISC